MIESITAPNPGPFTLDGTRSYIIDGVAVIDPGPVIDSHLDAILRKAPRLESILVTHRHGDHAPGAVALRERTGARVYAPAESLQPAAIDHALQDGDHIVAGSLTLEAIATPGHTAEHFCFLGSGGELFTGDTILGEGTTVIFPPDGHMGSYLASLEKLLGRNPARIYPGHGPTRDDATLWIRWYIEHRRERENQILETLRGGPASVSSLRRAVYPELDPRLERAAELQLRAHLTHLEEEGAVRQERKLWARA
ncbi:MAG: MBL fold metallo-hydrolase [Thermoanaerobaculia bacterium]